MDENCLSGLEFRHVHKRLPRSQRAHRYSRGFHEVERLWFRSNFPFFDGHVIRPTTAESRITVNRVAYFELGNVRPRFLDNRSDVVARNQRQMGAELLRVFPAERERIGWIDAAGDHAHERFIVVRFRSLYSLKLQHIGRAVFVGDHGLHLWLFLSADYADRHDSESG